MNEQFQRRERFVFAHVNYCGTWRVPPTATDASALAGKGTVAARRANNSPR